jgi:hypothetical protein
VSLNRIPTYQTRLETNDVTTSNWFNFWSGMLQGQPTGNISALIPGVSPYSYQATQGGSVVISGGTVSIVELSRDGVAYYATGQTSGMFPVSMGDVLRVTYTVVPTMTFVPR